MSVKQALWKIHIPPDNKINHPHYYVANPNEQHQFDLLYLRNNVFEEHTYKYISTHTDVALRYKFTRALRTKKGNEGSFLLEATYEKGGVFKYPKVLQCDKESEYKSDMTKLLKKHNADIRTTKIKYKHNRTAFLKAF